MSPRALKYDDMRSGGTVGFRGSRTGDRMRLVSPIDPRDWIELEVGRFPLTDSEQLHYREFDDGKLIYKVTSTLGNKVEVEPGLVANADAADRRWKQQTLAASALCRRPLPCEEVGLAAGRRTECRAGSSERGVLRGTGCRGGPASRATRHDPRCVRPGCGPGRARQRAHARHHPVGHRPRHRAGFGNLRAETGGTGPH